MSLDYIKLGDCLELMQEIPDGSIDLILCDLPYGTTACKWDVIIPFEPLWQHYNRIIKDNGAIVLFGCEPFTSQLICSNLKHFKYNWIWCKDRPTGHLNVKKQPLRLVENISVFYQKQCLYNPQLSPKAAKDIRPADKKRTQNPIWGKMDKESTREIPVNMTYPKNLLYFPSCAGRKGKSNHLTEKPVELLEYLIKTYTNPGGVVLDNCMGSGSTCVAAINTGRRYIGYEKEQKYFDIANERIKAAKEAHQ